MVAGWFGRLVLSGCFVFWLTVGRFVVEMILWMVCDLVCLLQAKLYNWIAGCLVMLVGGIYCLKIVFVEFLIRW